MTDAIDKAVRATLARMGLTEHLDERSARLVEFRDAVLEEAAKKLCVLCARGAAVQRTTSVYQPWLHYPDGQTTLSVHKCDAAVVRSLRSEAQK